MNVGMYNYLRSVHSQLSHTADAFLFAPRSYTFTVRGKMNSVRENTLVIDLSVLPVRPSVAHVQKFLEDQIKLQFEDVKSIQLHHTRNCVLIEMLDKEIALRYQLNHNWKRSIVCADKAFKIPVYVDCEAVTVRVHDLPSTMSPDTISEYMLKFGEVISIRNETWKHYFPGISNGVRVLRMNLFRHIPSFITIANEPTMVTYINQPKICFHCGQAAHPSKTCKESSVATSKETTKQPSTSLPSNDGLFSQSDFPPLDNNNKKSLSPTPTNKPSAAEREQNDDEWTDIDDNTSISSTDLSETTNKRRRSKGNKETETKKVCTDQCFHNAGHDGIRLDTPSKEKSFSTKNKNEKIVTRNSKL